MSHLQNTAKSIGIVGYGRMGKEIEAIALERGHNIAFTVDPQNPQASAKNLLDTKDILPNTDIVIEFSLASAVVAHANIYAEYGVNAVVGTTGWENEKDTIESIVLDSKIAYVHGGNFSIGAHIFMRIGQFAARLLNKIPEYDVAIQETHHTQKKDRPSGTALMTAEFLLQELERKHDVAVDLPHDKVIDINKLAIVSHRIGQEPGLHEIIADSQADTISISHHARTRTGFALGAVLAAEWVLSKKSTASPVVGFKTVHDFINEWLL